MFTFARFAKTARTFAKDESGNFALMFAAASTAIMLTAGVAIDYTRMLSAKTQLTAALDSALLSTAKDLAKGKIDEAGAKARATRFFEANLAGTRFPAGSAQLINFKVNSSDNTVSANASSNVNMMFPVFGMPKSTKVLAKSGAGFSERIVEVSMVLDVTGSMGDKVKSTGTKKIDDLKKAAKVAVSAFLDGDADNTRVAIVPYANSVNAGALSVAVRDPSGNLPKDTCATERRGAEMYTDAGPTERVTRANELAKDSCPTAAVMPLTKNKTALNNLITSLKASGSTAGHIGLQWGQYMISPNWKPVLATSEDPADYGAPQTDKYIIMMTDGLFNTDYHKAYTPSARPGISQRSGLMAMGYCDALKANNVKVFTIGFDLDGIKNAGERAEATKGLMDCATDAGSFFKADSGKELEAAFRKIAAAVQTVRLTN